MKYKVYDPKTKKAEWIDEDECGIPDGLSFLEFLKKYGHVVESSEEEREEMEKAFKELEDSNLN